MILISMNVPVIHVNMEGRVPTTPTCSDVLVLLELRVSGMNHTVYHSVL